MIKHTGPANLTVINSNFTLHYNELEGLNTFFFEDYALCTPDDNITQLVTFSNNILTYDVDYSDIYNDVYIQFLGINKRHIEVYVHNNTFIDMWDSDKPFIDVEFTTEGEISISNNQITNCSWHQYFLVANSDDHIVINYNTFSNNIAEEKGFIWTTHAQSIEMHFLTITGATHGNVSQFGSLIYIETSDLGVLFLEGLDLSNNYAEGSTIEIGSSVGNVTIQDSKFYLETLHSNVDYISIGNPFYVLIDNITFEDNTYDHTDTEETTLVSILSIDIDNQGEVHMQYIELINSTVTFFHLHNINGVTNTTKIVRFEHLTIKDTEFDTSNDIISFGPLYTEQDVDIHLNDWLFENLNFTKIANLLHLKQQTLDPFIFENSIIQDVYGGHILVEPLTVSEDTIVAELDLLNITVHNSDFKDSTFLIIREHCKLIINTWDIYRNSATFRGTVLSVTDNNSNVNILNCRFNNNNGIIGGIFYINGNSVIEVHDSQFYSNFAVEASIAYISNQGAIKFYDCKIIRNYAISVGIIEVVDTIVDNSVIHTEISENEIIDSSITQAEILDPTNCANLWFASDNYISYLGSNLNLLNLVVTHALISTTEATFNILEGVDFTHMVHVSIGYAYHGHLTMDNCTVYNISLYSSAFILIGSDFSIDHTNVTNISKDAGSTARFLQIELGSYATLNNSRFENNTVSMINCFDSQMVLTDVIGVNIISNEYIIDWYFCEGVTFNKLELREWITNDLPGIIKIRETIITNVQNSYFYHNQLFVMLFESSTVNQFSGNIFDAINRGIQFDKNSNGTITDSIFQNMVQDIRDGDLYNSNIVNDGSAIGK